MRIRLGILLYFSLLATTVAQVTVTGNVKTLAGVVPGGNTAYEVRFTLRGSDTIDCRVIGGFIGVSIPPVPVDASTGSFTATPAGNDQINCGGQVNVTQWI